MTLLTTSLALELASSLLFALHWSVYSSNGIGLIDAQTFAQCAWRGGGRGARHWRYRTAALTVACARRAPRSDA